LTRAATHSFASTGLPALYAPVADELEAVETMLRSELRSRAPFVDELVRYGCLLGGKRLRPALLLLAGKAAGHLVAEHVVLATVVEMIHTATLVHDDVLDEADMRRHLATVHARWSNEASVLLGDYLFTHAFYLASTVGSTFACRTIGQATNIVCHGELQQVGSRGNYDLAEEEYLEIIEAKTAELCSCCCRLGAHYAGAEQETVEALARFGRRLGIAFQIADDLLDVTGDETATGKSLGTDLEKHKPTLPLIRLLSRAGSAERQQVLAILTAGGNHRREALAPFLARHEACEYARHKARSYAESARAEVAGLPDSPALDVLRGLTDFVVSRSM
jgi:octaprenyl-diphosphate synthase